MRLRADFWVSAYLRRCALEGAVAVLRRRGAAEAGAIFVKVDRLDGAAALYGPAPQSEAHENGERLFVAAPRRGLDRSGRGRIEDSPGKSNSTRISGSSRRRIGRAGAFSK